MAATYLAVILFALCSLVVKIIFYYLMVVCVRGSNGENNTTVAIQVQPQFTTVKIE